MSIEKRQRKNGVRWYVRLRRPDGSPYSRSFRTRKEAERFQASELADRDRGSWTDPAAGRITLQAWSEEWMASNLHRWRASTIDRHELALRRVWVPELGSRRLSSIQPRQLQALANQLAGTYAPWTVRGYMGTGRLLLADAVALDLLSRTPFRGIKLPPIGSNEKRVLTPAELHDLADAVGERWRCFIYVAGVLGLRFGEVAALTFDDVDLEAKRLTVCRAVSEVNGKLTIGPPKSPAAHRTIDMPDQMAAELEAHCSRISSELDVGAVLFTTTSGSLLRRSNFRRRTLLPAVSGLDLEGLTFSWSAPHSRNAVGSRRSRPTHSAILAWPCHAQVGPRVVCPCE